MYEVFLSLKIAAPPPPCVRFVFYGIAEQVNRRSLGSFSKPTFELAEGLERGCACVHVCACMCWCRDSLSTRAALAFLPQTHTRFATSNQCRGVRTIRGNMMRQ